MTGDLQAIVTTPVRPDGVDFEGARIALEPIRAEGEYAGTRATLPARSGKARLALEIDLAGAGGSVERSTACRHVADRRPLVAPLDQDAMTTASRPSHEIELGRQECRRRRAAMTS